METYKATNTKNGKFYIGSTNNFERRKREHLTSKENYPFQNALRKDPGAFEWEVWSDLCGEPVLEQALLDMWFGKECCYNLNPSAQHPPSPRGRVCSEETRRKKAENATGKRHAPETLQKLQKISKERGANAALVRMQNNPKRGKDHPASRPIVLTNLETGVAERFECVADAARKHGLNDGHLCAVAKGKRGQHKGYIAAYV